MLHVHAAMENNNVDAGIRRLRPTACLPPVRVFTGETVSKIRQQSQWEASRNSDDAAVSKPLRLPPIDLTSSTTLTSTTIPSISTESAGRDVKEKRKLKQKDAKEVMTSRKTTKPENTLLVSKGKGSFASMKGTAPPKNKAKGKSLAQDVAGKKESKKRQDVEPLLVKQGASYPKPRSGSGRKRKRKKKTTTTVAKERTDDRPISPQKLSLALELMRRVPHVPNSDLIYPTLLPPIKPRIPSPTHYKRNMPRLMYKKEEHDAKWEPRTKYDQYFLAQYDKPTKDISEDSTDDSAYDTDKKKCTGSDDKLSRDVSFWSSSDLDFRSYRERKYLLQDEKLEEFMKSEPRRRNATCEEVDKELGLGLVKFCHDLVMFTVMQNCF